MIKLLEPVSMVLILLILLYARFLRHKIIQEKSKCFLMHFLFLSMDVLSNLLQCFHPQSSLKTTFTFMSLCILLPLYKSFPLEKNAFSLCVRPRSFSLLHCSFAISSQLGITPQICNLNRIRQSMCIHKLFDLFRTRKNASPLKKTKTYHPLGV